VKPPAIKLTIEIGSADAGNPKIAQLLHAILGAFEPFVSATDIEELQAALDTALLSKRLAEPPRRRQPRKERMQ
jgi:hypothetical protein